MKITLWRCDRCGREYRQDRGRTFDFAVGTERDAVEGRTHDVFESIDLCFGCVGETMEQFVRHLPMDSRKNMLEEIKARCPN